MSAFRQRGTRRPGRWHIAGDAATAERGAARGPDWRGRGAHAIVIVNQAGWHFSKALKIPPNISLMPLSPKSSELNPVENIWQFMRDNWLSNRIFKSYSDILDQCCFAWNRLTDQP
jgi:transposase